VYYAAIASGGLWKTSNNGTTWTPLFDGEGSYALGVVELDPNDPQVVWVGTGENNAQRSVAFGDGVYKSVDGGTTWRNMGLEDSGHISQIWIDPDGLGHGAGRGTGSAVESGRRSGPVQNHRRRRELGSHPDRRRGHGHQRVRRRPATTAIRIVASSYQRRRHVWTLINGGPGSGIHRTSDGGAAPGPRSRPACRRTTWVASALPACPVMLIASTPSSRPTTNERHLPLRGLRPQLGKALGSRDHESRMYYNEITVDPRNPNASIRSTPSRRQ
jgi:hypothetical protein